MIFLSKLRIIISYSAISIITIFSGSLYANKLPILDFGGDFSLLNHNKVGAKLSDYRGKVVIMSFGFTSCPDICPVTLNQQKHLMTQLGEDASELQNLLITIDPERDTPEALKEYLSYFDPTFMGLTGTIDEIKAVAMQYHSSFKKHELNSSGKYIFGHTVSVFLIDQQGRLRGHYKIEKELDKLLADTRWLIKDKSIIQPVAIQTDKLIAPKIEIEGAWVRALPPTVKNSVAYMTINNNSENEDRLLSVHSPLAASAEVHEYFTENGLEMMRPVNELGIPAQGSLLIEPRGLHIMLLDIEKVPKVGDQVALTLKFQHAGEVKVSADVKDGVMMTHNHH